jgi:ubiquinone/menaquinone biosynthesis C-methylase UbiE
MALRKKSFTPALAFHALTPTFDAVSAAFGFGQLFFEEVGRLVDVQPSEQVLDVGCGTGRMLPILSAPEGTQVIGLDIDPRALSRARQRSSGIANIRIGQASIEGIPIPSKSIDVAVSTLTFHHLPDEVKTNALREIHRVLKPDGRLVVADFGPPTTRTQKFLLTLGGFLDGRDNVRTNFSGELPAMIEAAGFSTQHLRGSYHAVEFLLARPI